MGVMKRIIEAVGQTAMKRTPRMVEAAVLQIVISQQEGMNVRCGLLQYTPKQRKRIDAMADRIVENMR